MHTGSSEHMYLPPKANGRCCVFYLSLSAFIPYLTKRELQTSASSIRNFRQK